MFSVHTLTVWGFKPNRQTWVLRLRLKIRPTQSIHFWELCTMLMYVTEFVRQEEDWRVLEENYWKQTMLFKGHRSNITSNNKPAWKSWQRCAIGKLWYKFRDIHLTSKSEDRGCLSISDIFLSLSPSFINARSDGVIDKGERIGEAVWETMKQSVSEWITKGSSGDASASKKEATVT